MSPETIVAGTAALIAAVAAVVAVWNAKSASHQAAMAEEQSDSARRAVDIASAQLGHTRHEYTASRLDAQRQAFESVKACAWRYQRLIAECLRQPSIEHVVGLHRLIEDLPLHDPHHKVLYASLSRDSDLSRTLHELKQASTLYMASALVLLGGANTLDQAGEVELRRAVEARAVEYHRFATMFEHFGEEYFRTKLRDLSTVWESQETPPET